MFVVPVSAEVYFGGLAITFFLYFFVGPFLSSIGERRREREAAEWERRRKEKEQQELAERERQRRRVERKLAIIARGEIMDWCRRAEERQDRLDAIAGTAAARRPEIIQTLEQALQPDK